MRFVITSLVAATITCIVTFIIMKMWNKIDKKRGKEITKRHRICRIVLIWLVIFLLGFIGYFAPYYHEGEEAKIAMQGNDMVSVSEVSSGKAIFFDGPGEDIAMMFYPGAKVASEAYAPIMLSLAENSIDCFVVNMPAHMAFFGRGRGPTIMAQYDYDGWILAGHSLGGAMISIFAPSLPDVSGLVLFASYPSAPVPKDMPMLLFRGSEDSVLNMGAYAASAEKWSDAAVEIVIEGGNHAGYADYGPQRGDGNALITPTEQQAQVVADIVATFVK